MSTFWTPDGERPITPEPEGEHSAPPRQPAGAPGEAAPLSEEEAAQQAQLEELRQQLLEAPAHIVVANHAFGLFELAALHLSAQPANLDEAQLAIDALGALVDTVGPRLEDAQEQLVNGLASLRMAYVQIRQASEGADKN